MCVCVCVCAHPMHKDFFFTFHVISFRDIQELLHLFNFICDYINDTFVAKKKKKRKGGRKEVQFDSAGLHEGEIRTVREGKGSFF